MATVVEDIVGGRGYGFGGGSGLDGGLGLIALLALLERNGNNGLFGGGSGGDGISALNNIQGNVDTAAILGKLATLEGRIFRAWRQIA